jgi:uncharacterized Zn-binding protein involved in type VI secretion
MPAAVRQGDAGIPHCSPYVIASGSADVKINGRGAARAGDTSAPHLLPGRRCGTHSATIVSGSSSVLINGRPAATVGSRLALCTAVATGSADVIIGL